MKNLSAGNYALATTCRWWLRDEAEHEKTPPTQPMMFGNAVHRCIEHTLLGNGILDFAAAATKEGLRGPSWPGKVKRRYESWVMAAEEHAWRVLKPEKAFAFNTTTGAARELVGEGFRKYIGVDRSCELTLVIDALEVRDGVAHAYDWKTGRVNQTKDIGQIRVCALALARLHGVKHAVGHVVYIDDETCVDYQGGLSVDEFDMLGLEATLERIFRLEDSEPIPGPHCRSLYCAARESCTSYMIANNSAVGDEGESHETPDQD